MTGRGEATIVHRNDLIFPGVAEGSHSKELMLFQHYYLEKGGLEKTQKISLKIDEYRHSQSKHFGLRICVHLHTLITLYYRLANPKGM